MKERAEDGASAVADLLMQLAKVQAQRAFLGMDGGGGFFGWLGGALSGTRAGGGSVKRGQPYLVNERTARSEVFVPSGGGAILNIP